MCRAVGQLHGRGTGHVVGDRSDGLHLVGERQFGQRQTGLEDAQQQISRCPS